MAFALLKVHSIQTRIQDRSIHVRRDTKPKDQPKITAIKKIMLKSIRTTRKKRINEKFLFMHIKKRKDSNIV